MTEHTPKQTVHNRASLPPGGALFVVVAPHVFALTVLCECLLWRLCEISSLLNTITY